MAIAWSVVASGQDTVGTGAVRGNVLADDGTALDGGEVCIADTALCVPIDDAGRFPPLNVRPGVVRLEVKSASGGALVTGDVEVRAGLTIDISLALPKVEAVSTSVTVRASQLRTPDEVVTSGVRIENHEIAKSAGALQDVSRYVATLPGVVTGSADFRNDIIVRGGSPLENLFVVDNIEIPNINSFANLASAGGTVSLLDVQLIEDVTFLTGGYPAPYENRLSSVLQIAQREGNRERFRSRITVAYAGAGAVLEGPWANGQGSWLVSARRSFLDFFSEDIGTGGVPVFYSFTGKALRDLGARDRVWLTSISGIDRIRLGLSDTIDADAALGALDIRYSGQRSATGVNWQRTFGSRAVGLLGVTHSSARVDSTVKDLVRGGPLPPGADISRIIDLGATTFRQDSTEARIGLKYDLTVRSDRLGEVRFGGRQQFYSNDYLTLSPLGYDGPFTTIPDINPIDLRESFGASQAGIYLQTTHRLGGLARLTLGARLDRYSQFGATHARLSPRAGVSLPLGGNLSWNASWGIYHQMPLYLFMAAFPQNRLLEPARSQHWVTGIAWERNGDTRITVEAYAKTYRNYAVSTQFPSVSLANIGDTFDVRDILYPMTSAGRGKVRGIELLAEKKFSGDWFGQFNLAFSRSQHAGLDDVLRRGAFDRPFVANVVGGKRIAKVWEVALRSAYFTGRPYTPFLIERSEAQRRGIFDLGQVNALRYMPFFTLDLRVDRTFRYGDRLLVLYVGVQNVTGRENATNQLWNRRTNRPEIGTGLPLFPLVGMEFSL